MLNEELYEEDHDDDYEEEEDCELISPSSSEKPPTKKRFNKVKYFYDNYKEEFESLLNVPLIAVARDRYNIVPYEYSTKTIRYRRNTEELDEELLAHGARLALYCLDQEIEKSILEIIGGGNLYSYNSMRKSFGRR